MLRLIAWLWTGIMTLASFFMPQSDKPVLLPNENELYTHLWNDRRALPPTQVPNGLLCGLSGVKDGDSAVKEASRYISQKLDGLKAELRSELEDRLNDLEQQNAQRLAAISVGGLSQSKDREEGLEHDLVGHYMRTGSISAEKLSELQKLTGKKATPFTAADNSFIVPAVVDKAILEVIKTQSTLLQRVHSISASVGYQKVIMRDGNSGRASETTERTVLDAPLASNIDYSGGELYTVFQVSQWAIDDAGYDLEGELIFSIGEEFAYQIEREIVAGGGTTEFTGLNQVLDAAIPTFGELRRVTALGATVSYDDLLNTVLSVPKRYRQGSVWIVSPTTLAGIIGMRDSNDNLVFQPALNDQDTGRLLGYPVEESEDVAAGRIAYFGNLKRGYSVHFVTGTRLIRDPFTRKGFVEFYVSRRVRGGVGDATGLSVLVESNAS